MVSFWGFQVDMFNVMLKCLHSHDNTLCDPGYDRLHMIHPLLTQATDILSVSTYLIEISVLMKL